VSIRRALHAALTEVLQKHPLKLANLWWLAGWGMVLFVTVVCLEPPRYVPDLHVSDKVEHASAYFGLTFWFGGLVGRTRYLILACWMLAFGAAIEVAQGLMGWGRTADIWDLAADAVGVAMALALVYIGFGSWMSWIERLLGLSREPN
jgi:VanZ family protein